MNDDDLRRALALIDERRFAEAIDLAADAATFSPIDYPVLPTEFDDAPSSVARALALQWCLQDQQVVDLLEPVVEATPDQALAWLVLGTAWFWRIGTDDARPGRALECMQRAAELAPEDPFAASGLGLAQAVEGRRKAALVAFERAAALAPDSWLHAQRLAEHLAAAGKTGRAREWAARSTELAAGRSSGWLLLGQLLAETEERAEALECFDRALAIDPSSSEALEGKVELLRQDPDAESQRALVEALRDLLDRLPEHQQHFHDDRWRLLGRAHEALGEEAEARAAFDRAEELATRSLAEQERKEAFRSFWTSIRKGDRAGVDAGLAAAFDLAEHDPTGDRDPVHAAVRSSKGKTAIVDLLIAHGLPVDRPDGTGQTPLMSAASKGYATLVERLLSAGANPSHRDRSGGSALHLAARAGKRSACVALLEGGADPSILDGRGKTPQELAEGAGRKALAKLLGT
ncbi:MAG TPA: ankyrin repeat domain-containing protein [Polyangiaceae bacterium LLY-WYZ-15_(1-7)]|nr:ankyrin repeat domain-containing protein [Polyangiaceae bacterium LLY-WYZ-15_(1-7)]HJL10144.1 ankyrin repeat domain-containing protein [Polyangiaceae bacterium LLY-WYZ-15_(1-7)]HJL30730.1 ankyrin repeat domain-containing protein [Polyangiaceae bacterium LLY-WYZ-15_(1-7)]HJL38784.1 ankyrin repeat domain-containing protein [Polyangiaceae bacterium LLY-WYZ-15_(1-7)]